MLKIVFLLIFIIILFLDYSKTKGFIKAKIFHALALSYLFYVHLDSFKWVIGFIRQYDIFQMGMKTEIGFISENVNFYQNIIFIILGLFITFFAFGMLSRSNIFRNCLTKIILFIIPFGVISFYTGFKQQMTAMNDYLILIIGIIIVCGIYLSIFLLYRSAFMKEFFNAKLLGSS